MPKGQPGTKAPHGTLSRYTGHGCRCDDCRRAAREWSRSKYGKRPREIVDAERAAKHGTESKYKCGCRCEACRAASAANREARRARRKVPCARCGRPRLDRRDVGGSYRGPGTNLCGPCYQSDLRAGRIPGFGRNRKTATA